MGLADKIKLSHELLYRKQGGATCTVNIILDYLPKVDRQALSNVLEDSNVFGTSISDLLHGWAAEVADASSVEKDPAKALDLKVLSEVCLNISDTTIQRHRRHKCQCSKES